MKEEEGSYTAGQKVGSWDLWAADGNYRREELGEASSDQESTAEKRDSEEPI